MSNNKSGISLVTLIITIVVIIILAAILYVGTRTPDQATFAMFTTEYADMGVVVKDDFVERYGDSVLNNDKKTRAQIYYQMASGIDVGAKGKTQPAGTVDELNGKLPLSEGIKGEEYYQITENTIIDGWDTDKYYYSPDEKHYVTDEGEIFVLPGYLVEQNGQQQWWINETKYYTDKPITGEDNPGGGTGDATQEFCTITFTPNSGSGKMDEEVVVKGSTYTLPANRFTAPSGQVFSGWNVNGTVMSAGDAITVSEDITIKAEWRTVASNEYEITIEANNGTGTVETETVEAGSYTLPSSSKFSPAQGREFDYWSVEGVIKEAGDTITITKNTTITAMWKTEKCTITFDSNGGTGTMESSTVTYGATYILPSNGFTAPEHKRFANWEVNGDTKTVGSTITINSDTTITAIWETVTYTVTLVANNGTSTIKTENVFAGTYTLPANEFTVPKAQKFVGWSVNGETKTAGTGVTIEKNTVITAVWKAIELTVEGIEASYQYTGSAIKPVPIVKGDGVELTEGQDYEVTYGTNLDKGTGTVTVTYMGHYEGTKEITFEITVKEVDGGSIVVNNVNSSYIYTGSAIKPVPEIVVDGITLTASDYTVAYGENTNKGTGTITITLQGNYSGSKEVTFTIAAKNIAEDDITISNVNASYTYTGSQITPVPSVVVDRSTLATSTYTVEYGENVDVGTGTVKVILGGNYEGSREISFNIVAKSISAANILTNTINTSYAYTGSEIKPITSVTVEENTLEEGIDYEVAYTNNINVGTEKAKATITLKGNYDGNKEISFEIVPKKLTVEIESTQLEYTGEEQKPTVSVDSEIEGEDITLEITTNPTPAIDGGTYTATVTIASVTNGNVTNYELTNSTFDFNINRKEFTVTFNSSDGTGTMEDVKVKDRAEYVLPECTFIAPNYKKFDSWSVNGETKAVGDTITVTSNITIKAIWKVSEYTLTFVADNGTSETKTDMVTAEQAYTLPACDFKAPINKVFAGWLVNGETKAVGDEIIITGDTTITATWSEVALSVTGVAESYEYIGSQITPEPVVTGNVTALIKGTDYDVAYGENLNAGATKGTVTVTFKGAYSGVETIEFTITPKNISSVTMELDITEYTFDGTAKTPGVTVTDGSLGGLTQNTDYTVAWTNNTKAGLSTDANTPTVTITGANNYTGTKSVTFTIKKANMEVSESNFSDIYDGTARSATVTVTTPSTGATIWYKEGTELTADNYDTVGSTTVPTRTNVGNSQIFYYVVAENYNDYSGSVNTVITQRAVTVKADDITRKYNGEELTSTAATASGLADGHKLGTVTTTGKITNVGSVDNEITSVTILDASNNDVTGNYNITPVKGTLTITPENAASFTITVGSYDNVYSGTVKTPSVTVKVGTNTVPESEYIVSHSNNVDAGTTATVTVTGKEGGNYEGSTGSANFTITQKPLTLTAGTDSKVYDGTALEVTNVTSEGLVSGHTLTATTQGSQTNVGSSANTIATYSIKSGDEDVAKNYKVEEVDGTLTVTVKTVTVTPGTTTLNYNGSAQKPTATVSGAADGETINLSIITEPESAKEPGTYSATVTIGSVTGGSGKTSNYTLSGTTTFNFTIKARIAFSANRGTGSMSNQYATLNSSYTLPANGFTAPTNYIFNGWLVNGTTYAAGSKITISGNTTVTAQWKQNIYTVSFDANGGSGSMAAQTVTAGSSYTLPANGFTAPSGQEFYAWSVDGTTKNVSDTITVTSNTTIKAVWQYLPLTDSDTGKTVNVLTDDKITNSNLINNSNISMVVQAEGETMQVPIPTGFEYSLGTGNTGLVVEDTAGNEFVWIPVEDVTTMYKTGESRSMNAYDSDFSVTTNMWGNTSTTEPGIITGINGTTYDAIAYSTAGFSSLEAYATDLKNEFNAMINSVGKYGGFYVGRYEIGYDNGIVCKSNVRLIVEHQTSTNANCYSSTTYGAQGGLYKACKAFTKGGVKSSMIWNCQWDKMVEFIGDHCTTGITSLHKTGQCNDQYKHVHDTSTNARERTSGVGSYDLRTSRGGSYNIGEYNASQYFHDSGTLGIEGGTRPQLYIK